MNKVILLVVLILFGCQSQKSLLKPGTKIAANFNNVSPKQIASKFLISPRGIGKAKLGMTLGQLKQISSPDTEFNPISPFSSELNALAVVEQGLVQYYILYNTNANAESTEFMPKDSDVITLLMTNNDNYQTEEGIKVGTPIQEAENIYGNAVLTYNVDGESIEYITFGKYSSDRIRFRASYFKLISDGLGFAGIYPEYPGVAYTTDKYNSDAAIAAIEVSCSEEDCL